MPGVVITSGHQPGFHHPGILAKRFAMDATAAAADGSSTWLIADQDVDDPEVIRYPDLDDEGRLVARSWHVVPSRRGIPTALRPWGATSPPPRVSPGLPASIQQGLDEIHEALESVEGTTVAERFTAANEHLLTDHMTQQPSLVRASRLLETEAGQAAVARILEDPRGCLTVWNESLKRAPRAARRLKSGSGDPDEIEVPAWILDAGSRRRPATVGDLKAAIEGSGRIMPRAFLMTAVFRSLTGATMIHGTGGGRYEVVTDHWARTFLGLELPPIRVVTCDLRLPLDSFVESTTHPGMREAIRTLEHDPWDAAGIKQEWVERIREAPRNGMERRSLFTLMHQAMAERRRSRTDELERMRRIEADEADRTRRTEIARSRSWPWPLYDRGDLLACMNRHAPASDASSCP
ncbi:MAG: hypothetical protein VX641_07960 [Planctomycetota bacterium]|nr:hypothetical protein [Planctomycetota bacterium]